MEFTSNLWIMVGESDRITEEHKKELYAMLTEMQNIENELMSDKSMVYSVKARGRMMKLGDAFEKAYIKYGGYMVMINECKRIELKRTEGELKELLPKIPRSVKIMFKVK